MKAQHHFLLAGIAILGLCSVPAAAFSKTVTYVYDFGDNVGPAGTLLSTDGWAGDDIGNWVTNNFLSELYARNNNAGDDQIFRPNDANFSYSIPANTTFVSLEIIARTPTFWQAGLAQNGNTRLAIGGEFGANDKFFILDQFNRINESGASAAGDTLDTLRLDLDIATFTADLTLNGSSLLIDDAALTTLNFAELIGSNELYVRTNSQFSGPARITLSVTTIPEPGAFVLAALSAIGLVLVVRRRVRTQN